MPIVTFISNTIVRRYKRWNRRLTIPKRQLFVIITIILTAGMLLTQLVSPDLRYPMVLLLSSLTYLLTAFALREDLTGVEWITLLILPTLFTAAVAVFYFLLPTRWLTRIPVAVVYALGMYALLLTENIYNIAAIRTIALTRAAHSVGFLLTLITFYLLAQTIMTTRIHILINMAGIMLISFLLSIQMLWSVTLERYIAQRTAVIAVTICIVCGEIAWIISLLPSNLTFSTLFLTTCFYGLVGIGVQYLQDRLYRKTVQEFIFVIMIMVVVFFAGLSWR